MVHVRSQAPSVKKWDDGSSPCLSLLLYKSAPASWELRPWAPASLDGALGFPLPSFGGDSNNTFPLVCEESNSHTNKNLISQTQSYYFERGMLSVLVS